MKDLRIANKVLKAVRVFAEWLLYSYCECKGVSYMTEADKQAIKEAKHGEIVLLNAFEPATIIKRCKDE